MSSILLFYPNLIHTLWYHRFFVATARALKIINFQKFRLSAKPHCRRKRKIKFEILKNVSYQLRCEKKKKRNIELTSLSVFYIKISEDVCWNCSKKNVRHFKAELIFWSFVVITELRRTHRMISGIETPRWVARLLSSISFRVIVISCSVVTQKRRDWSQVNNKWEDPLRELIDIVMSRTK